MMSSSEEVMADTEGKSLQKNQERFDANMAALRMSMPGLYEILLNHEPMSELVFLENGEPDVVFRGTGLYEGRGAFSVAKEQSENMERFLGRKYMAAAESDSLDPHSREPLNMVVGAALRDRKMKFLVTPESEDAYFLFFLGIGLGVSINHVLDTFKPKVATFYEPNVDFLYHSLFVFDWKSFLRRCSADGIQVEIHTFNHDKAIASKMAEIIRNKNPCAADGTAFFHHYQNSTFTQAMKEFNEKTFPVAMMGLGFFEDEINMISQTYLNLRDGTARGMHKAGNLEMVDAPVFIVGNGPSLDDQKDYIRKFQDRAVIISCGTAIDALLKNDIQPDFQIQIERDIGEYRLYRYTMRNYDLSKIGLIASTTIYPGISDMFGPSILFFRPGLSSMPLFCTDRDNQILWNADPSVTNTGLAFAQAAGFRSIYMFGCDVGAKSPDHHHSKDSLYHAEDLELPWYIDPKINISLSESMTIEVPGNFGGTVYTNGNLAWTRNALESAIRMCAPGRQHYNCSDGALIEGAKPMLPSGLDLQPLVEGKEHAVKALIEDFPVYDRAAFESVWQADVIFGKISAMADGICDLIDSYESFSDKEMQTKLMDFYMPWSPNNSISMLYRGSGNLAYQALNYYLKRTKDEDDFAWLNKKCKEEYKRMIREMERQSIEVFSQLDEGTHPADPKNPNSDIAQEEAAAK